ncbi:MAG: ABC transporter substrate-binding protein, partial [Acidimicrobiales bacterium]
MTTAGIALVMGASAIGAGTGGSVAASAAAPPTPGVTPTTVTVGSISDISAPVPGLFEGAKIGTEAYFAYINSQGGVNGRKLVLDARDSAFSSGTIANATQSIAKNEFAIVGGFS